MVGGDNGSEGVLKVWVVLMVMGGVDGGEWC